MSNNRGFTLLEALIAAAILAIGLTSVAAIFAYSTRTNRTGRQRAEATALLSEKLEQLRSARFNSATWMAGGSVDPAIPIADYFDVITPTDGIAYLRMWQIEGDSLRTATVVVYAQNPGLTGARELARATTLGAAGF